MYVYSLLSSLLCVAGSCLVFTWLPFCRQLTISDGPNAGNTAPAKCVRQMAKSAEKSRQPATLFGYSKSGHILRVTWSTQSSPFSCFGSRRGQQQ